MVIKDVECFFVDAILKNDDLSSGTAREYELRFVVLSFSLGLMYTSL